MTLPNPPPVKPIELIEATGSLENSIPSVFAMEALRETELRCRRSLIEDPTDMIVRIDLAWCLLLQAVNRAGQETVQAALAARDRGGESIAEDQSERRPSAL